MIEVILNTDELDIKSRQELYEIIKNLICHIEDEHIGAGTEYVPELAKEVNNGLLRNNQFPKNKL